MAQMVFNEIPPDLQRKLVEFEGFCLLEPKQPIVIQNRYHDIVREFQQHTPGDSALFFRCVKQEALDVALQHHRALGTSTMSHIVRTLRDSRWGLSLTDLDKAFLPHVWTTNYFLQKLLLLLKDPELLWDDALSAIRAAQCNRKATSKLNVISHIKPTDVTDALDVIAKRRNNPQSPSATPTSPGANKPIHSYFQKRPLSESAEGPTSKRIRSSTSQVPRSHEPDLAVHDFEANPLQDVDTDPLQDPDADNLQDIDANTLQGFDANPLQETAAHNLPYRCTNIPAGIYADRHPHAEPLPQPGVYRGGPSEGEQTVAEVSSSPLPRRGSSVYSEFEFGSDAFDSDTTAPTSAQQSSESCNGTPQRGIQVDGIVKEVTFGEVLMTIAGKVPTCEAGWEEAEQLLATAVRREVKSARLPCHGRFLCWKLAVHSLIGTGALCGIADSHSMVNPFSEKPPGTPEDVSRSESADEVWWTRRLRSIRQTLQEQTRHATAALKHLSLEVKEAEKARDMLVTLLGSNREQKNRLSELLASKESAISSVRTALEVMRKPGQDPDDSAEAASQLSAMIVKMEKQFEDSAAEVRRCELMVESLQSMSTTLETLSASLLSDRNALHVQNEKALATISQLGESF